MLSDKLVVRGKSDTSITHLHNHSISRLDADDSIKRGGDKRAMQDQISLFEMIVTYK